MEIRASEEMYLETILRIKNKKSFVRSIDIVEERGFAKSSVSRAVNLLQDRGYIVIASDGKIEFTPKGQNRATRIYERHCVLTELLMYMGAERDVAEDNACRIEHVLTEDMFLIIKNYVQNIEKK